MSSGVPVDFHSHLGPLPPNPEREKYDKSLISYGLPTRISTGEQLRSALQELESRLLARQALPSPPFPQLEIIPLSSPVQSRLNAVQRYLHSFDYNHNGIEYCRIDKERSLGRIMQNAKQMMRDCLPIKCLEAVVLGVYLTREYLDIVRIPLRFKTSCDGNSYWHIVLAVSHQNTWGSIGISRRPSLDYRPLIFPSLASLIASFKESYASLGHKVARFTIGFPFGRMQHSNDKVFWHFLVCIISQLNEWSIVENVIDKYMKGIARFEESMRRNGVISQSQIRGLPYTTYEPNAKHGPQLTFKYTVSDEEKNVERADQQTQNQGTDDEDDEKKMSVLQFNNGLIVTNIRKISGEQSHTSQRHSCETFHQTPSSFTNVQPAQSPSSSASLSSSSAALSSSSSSSTTTTTTTTTTTRSKSKLRSSSKKSRPKESELRGENR